MRGAVARAANARRRRAARRNLDRKASGFSLAGALSDPADAGAARRGHPDLNQTFETPRGFPRDATRRGGGFLNPSAKFGGRPDRRGPTADAQLRF